MSSGPQNVESPVARCSSQASTTPPIRKISAPRLSPQPHALPKHSQTPNGFNYSGRFALPHPPHVSNSFASSTSSVSTEDPFGSAYTPSASSSHYSPPLDTPSSSGAGQSSHWSVRDPRHRTRPSGLLGSNGIKKKKLSRKEHIHARLHKENVRENMQKELYALKLAKGSYISHCTTSLRAHFLLLPGYSADYATFQGQCLR